jgi:hypothetical protein
MPNLTSSLFSFLCPDLLEPRRKDTPALVETHKVRAAHFPLFFVGVVNGMHPWNAHPGAFVCRAPPQTCCRYDDEIFEHIMRDFPEFAAAPYAALVTLDEDMMKSKEGKERWRTFINACVPCPTSPLHPVCLFNSKSHAHAPNTNRYEKKITDFNFGSLIRTNSTKEYSETNTIFGELDLFLYESSQCRG